MENLTRSKEKLVELLDSAVGADCTETCCENIKRVLEDAFRAGSDILPKSFLQPVSDGYARRLLHKDPQGRYSVVVMVWGVGQGTPLHDHAGRWCVECVYSGRIKVDSYDLKSGTKEGIVQFEPMRTVHAGVGEAGALIPPFEYHTIVNVQDVPSVTIHVYAEELTECNVFVPVEGGYRQETKQLTYSN